MATWIELICSVCEKPFDRLKKDHAYHLKKKPNYRPTCSKECQLVLVKSAQTFPCGSCATPVIRTASVVRDSKLKVFFCSNSCSATYTNTHREQPTINDKELPCFDCGEIVVVNGHTSAANAKCQPCKDRHKAARPKHKQKRKPRVDPKCDDCGVDLPDPNSRAKYCAPCRKARNRAAGLKSAQSQALTRRSKNEIRFAELCQTQFKNVECNAAIFTSSNGNWDADVIIHDHKIAVLWNGAWHHKKIRAKHSVLQVQTRDKIKKAVIKANGYIPYVIDDFGESSKEKDRKALVENEFAKFLVFIERLKSLTNNDNIT